MGADESQAFPLMKLPLELRREVYRHYFQPDDTAATPLAITSLELTECKDRLPALLQVNNEIFMEALSIYIRPRAVIVNGDKDCERLLQMFADGDTALSVRVVAHFRMCLSHRLYDLFKTCTNIQDVVLDRLSSTGLIRSSTPLGREPTQLVRGIALMPSLKTITVKWDSKDCIRRYIADAMVGGVMAHSDQPKVRSLGKLLSDVCLAREESRI